MISSQIIATNSRQAPADQAAQPTRLRFTVRSLRCIKPSDRQLWVYDNEADGLALLVLPSDVRTFYFAKRIGGRYRRVKIGRFPSITIEQARRETAKFAGKVAAGENPADARQQVRGATTLGDLWQHYLNTHAKVHKRTWREDERQYDAHLKRLASRRLDQITRPEIAAIHAKVGKYAPIAANRLLALVSKLFNVGTGVGFTGANPAKGIQRFKEATRDRFLDAEELPRFLDAVGDERNPTIRDFLRVLLFTGQRRENVASMCWNELDLKRRVWTIPAAKFKMGQAVDIPLAAPVLAILKARRQVDPDGLWVFPSHRQGASTPYLSEPRGGFDRVCERAGIKSLRMHDLRRTTASWATMIGTPYPTSSRVVPTNSTASSRHPPRAAPREFELNYLAHGNVTEFRGSSVWRRCGPRVDT